MLTQLRRDLRKTVPYVLAAALIPATLWIRQVLIHAPDDKPAFIIFTAPVFLTAYIGGLGPGVVATILGALCIDYYVLAPKGSLTIESPLDVLSLIIFTSVCLAVSVAGEQLHRTRRDAEASRLLTGSLAHAAEHDSLTGLPNRRLLTTRLRHAIALTERNGGIGAVLFLDLDNFKDVNDAFGHAAGDELLVAVAARLRNQLRQVDTPARVGGDEFVVLLEDLAGPETAATVARSLIARLAEPLVLAGGDDVRIGVSIGISVFPTDARDPESAMRHGDMALYQAKAAGRATCRFYDEALARAVDAPGSRGQLGQIKSNTAG
jgi:diguanylate cyclase (GGDEF)-like protein